MLGDQLTSPARASILGLYFCSSSAAPRLSLAGLASKTSSSSWLPSLPCLVAGTGVGVWPTGLDPLWGQDPSPGAAPGSLPTPTCQLTVLMSCLFSIAKLQISFPSSHHCCSHSSSLGSALHRHSALMPSLAENTSPIHAASHHLDSLRPCWLSLLSFLISFPSKFWEMEAMLSTFSESKTAMGSSRKTCTHEVCTDTDTPTDTFLYVNY